jgi:hypothetical protein
MHFFGSVTTNSISNNSQNQHLACFDDKRFAPKKIIKPSRDADHHASTKAKASATASTPHAVTHCVIRLIEEPSEEPAAIVATPGPESVGKNMRPDEVEASAPAPDC